MSALVVMALLGSAADEALLRQAADAFGEGLQRQQASEKSRRYFLEAARAYEGVSQRGPAIWRAIGNSYRLAGDLPRAVLAYRQGLREYPGDPALGVCLELARERVAYEGALGRPREEAPLVWQGPTRMALLALSWLVLCLATTRYLMVRERLWMLWVVIGVVGTVGLGGWWVSDALRPAPLPVAVIARDGVQLRRGDGPLFAPRHPQPFYRGTEAVIHRTRGEWSLIEVTGGVGWVRHADLVT